MKARWGENVQHYSFFNLGAIWVGWSRHVPAALPPRKETRYLVYTRLCGPQGRPERVRKISPPPGFDPRTVQHEASRYTDWANRGQLLSHFSHPLPANHLVGSFW